MLPSSSVLTTTTFIPAMTGAGRVGAMGRGRDQAHVPVPVTPVQVVGPDHEKAGIFPVCARVGHHGRSRKPGDLLQPRFQVPDDPLVPLGLIRRREGVEVGELRPGDGHHLRGGVQLHGARSEGDHAGVQGEVLGFQLVDVPEHLGLRVIPVEDGMRQVALKSERRCRGDSTGNPLLGQFLGRDLPLTSEHREEVVHVTGKNALVQGDPDGAVAEVPEVDAPIEGAPEDRLDRNP